MLIGFLCFADVKLLSLLFAGCSYKLDIDNSDDVQQLAGEVLQTALSHSGQPGGGDRGLRLRSTANVHHHASAKLSCDLRSRTVVLR